MPNTKDQKGSPQVASGAGVRTLAAAVTQSSQFISLIPSTFGPKAAANNTPGQQSTKFLVALPVWSTPSQTANQARNLGPPCFKS